MGALLLRLGADCTANDGHGYNLLTKAAELGDLETVRILIRDFKINPNINDARGHSALTRATAANKQDVIEFLIDDSNIDPNEKDAKGWSPLKIATEMRNLPLMQLLVSQGADPLPYFTENKALQNNLCSGLDEMYSSGEHLNLHDVKNRYNVPESVPETKEDIIKYFQEQLQESCFTHHMLSILTSEYSPDSMVIESEKKTSLFSPRMELRLVHEASEKINSQFQDLLQTLKRLTQEKFSTEELASLAQVKGISLDPAQISLSHILERTQEKIKKLHLSIATLKKTGEELQQQITLSTQQGSPPRDENKLNLATYAVASKNKILINLLADTYNDLSSPDPEGYTPLERAVMSEDPEIFELLVEKGADLTRSDKEGFTLTTRAASAGRLPLLQYFSDKHKIDLSSPDSEGRTPYSEAVKTQQQDVIQYLHEKGAHSAPPAFPAKAPEPEARPSPPYFFRPYHFHERPPMRPFLSPHPRRPQREVPQQPLQVKPPAVLQPAEIRLPPPVLPPPPMPPQQEPIVPVLRHINIDNAPDIYENPTVPRKEGWGAWFLKMGATALGGTLHILGQTGGVIWNYGRQFVKRPIQEELQTPPETIQPQSVEEPLVTPSHVSPLLPGQRIITKTGKHGPKKLRLEVIKFLSAGTFKKVYKAHTFKASGGGQPKLKAYAEPTRQTAASDLLHDCAISKLFRDQLGIREVVKIREVRSSTGVGALMEFCDQGDLFSFLQKEKNPITRMTLALEFTNGLAKMHSHKYCHLDLKLLNILVKTEADGRPHIRIGDLGTCQPTHIGKKARITPLCGTYPAPEVNASKKQNHEVPVSPSLDLWVLGDILYSVKYGPSALERFGLSHAAIGKPEFLTKVQTLQQHVESLASQSHDPLDRCIADLFSSDPARRPSAAIVAQKIQEWIQRQPH